MKDVQQRIVTGILAGSAALLLTMAHPYSFALLLIAAYFIGIKEWKSLNVTNARSFHLIGSAYLLSAITALAWLRIQPFANGDTPTYGAHWILGLFALVWTTDIAAYVIGRSVGGPKIAPAISPNKTWSGGIGALAATALVAAYLSRFIPSLPLAVAIFAGALLSALSQAGDFLESWLKRRAGVKDSGSLLPGHGGLLDRVDGLLPASIMYAAFVYFYLAH